MTRRTTDEEIVAARQVFRRLGPVGTRDLLGLLECPRGQRPHAIAQVGLQDQSGAVIAQIASRLHRDEPMLRRFARALRRVLEGG